MRKIHIKGFTLLELLVVIGIIGLLVGLGAISYSTAQKKARDSRRKSDLKVIQNAMEQYYSICGYQYPTPVSGDKFSAITCLSPSTSLLPTIPVDPKTTTPYPCPTTSCTNEVYQICPPDLGSGKLLETEACTTTNKSCCLQNQQ